jgi:hypothetical protein
MLLLLYGQQKSCRSLAGLLHMKRRDMHEAYRVVEEERGKYQHIKGGAVEG